MTDHQVDYWRQALTGLEPLELPTDRRRSTAPDECGHDTITFAVSAGVTGRLAKIAAGRGASLSTTLLAVFQALLSGYSGQDDIAVGTPAAGAGRRDAAGDADILIIRTDLSGDPTFVELLDRVERVAVAAGDHQGLPFARFVTEFGGTCDLSRTPMFALHGPNSDGRPAASPDGESGGGSELALDVAESEGGLRASMQFRTDVFERATVERLVGHFQALLASAVASPGARLSELDMLTAEERRRILVEWNDTAGPYPDTATIHELVEERVGRCPDAVAVSFGSESLTFRQVNERANALAHHLREQGVVPGTLIAVCLDRSPDLICALLGILKAGGAYVPLDPDYPTDRLTYMVEDTATPLVVTHTRHADRLPAGIPRLLVDRDWPVGAITNPVSVAGPDDPAYVIYTSGSTGRPKGVRLNHRGVVNYLHWCDLNYPPHTTNANSVGTLLYSSVTFDLTVTALFLPLIQGLPLDIPQPGPDQSVFDAAVETILTGVAISFLKATPSHLEVLAAHLELTGKRHNIATIVAGGEGLSPTLAHRILATGSGTTVLCNEYGPTECSVANVMSLTTAVDPEWETTPVGVAITNTKAYVVDRYNRPVPIGVPGECLLGGICVARGYLNRPELTEARFVPDPFSDDPNARVYRTGDLVKWRPDGQLEFIGRIDNQVKLRGYRIELGEIENNLLTHPAITATTVIVREDTPGDKRLVAYTVTTGDAGITTGELRTHLRQHLPDHMVPAVFVTLDHLPLTPNGKVDRKALPAPDGHRPDLDTTYTAPRTPVEQAVTGIWSDVLGIDTIGVHDNFFELGGHSLLATQVTSRIRQTLGVEVPVRALFAAPTPARLATAIDAMDTDDSLVILPAGRDDGPLPLSFAQQRLWFLDQLEPGRAEYLIPFGLRVRGPLDTALLEGALGGLVARHEVLRTRFVAADDGRPTQLVDAPWPVTATVHDLRGIEDAAARDAAAREILETEAVRPFDLATGPLLRAVVAQVADEDRYLLITIHHIVSDGWSEGILAHELREHYAAALDHREVALPALPLQYADFSVWQRQWLTGDTLDRQLDYWRGKLTGLEPLELPTDHHRPPVRSGASELFTFNISDELVGRLKSTATDRGASLFMTLLATFQLLLSKYSGQEDVAVGTPIAGRNRAEIEDMIGFFVNTLVMRTDLSGDPTFTELLARVRDTALGAYDHQDLPFERLVEEIAPRRDLSRNPLFQAMFVLQNVPEAHAWALPGLTVESVPITSQDAKFDLTLFLTEQSDGSIDGTVVYATDLFEQATVARLAGHFRTLLSAVAAGPGARLAVLDMLTPAERRQILVEWNDTTTDYPDTKTVHELVEEQVDRRPEAIAITCDAGTLTYRELNERANRLAHHLRGLGIGPEHLVTVCLDRSPDMICALLAILKAGAAYVPLDPDYPADRLAFMIEDTATPLVITDSGHAHRLPATAACFLTDRDWSALTAESGGNPEPLASPQDLAYVIYTSGSTGRPKGVQIRHHSLVNLVHWTMTSFAMKPGDRVALLAGVGFDAAAWELWPALTAGTTSCITTDTIRLTPDLLQQWLQDQNIRGTFVPTPMLEALAALPWNNTTTSLEYVLTGGDLLHLPTDTTLPFRVINNYGPTESTVLVTSTQITPGDPIPPIGRPIANTNLYIVDKHHHPVPIGIPGELLIAGTGLALGYLNQPEQTRDRFIPNPFSTDPDARVYRTGDLVKWRPDGQMEFIGRIDNQVKLRGYRIELGEIEATLLTHPTVTAATVIAREDTPGDKRLVAYTVTTADTDIPKTAELRAHLQQQLPDYMVPAAFVTLDQLPLTTNGKVDRKALPLPDGHRPDLDATYTAPRTPVERAITAIWSDVLTVDTIGIHDNFFELGGHSLLATQVTSRIRKTLGVDVPVRTLFTAPTPAQLATAIDGMHTDESTRITPTPRDGNPLPLSFAQQRLWFLDQLEPARAEYLIPFALRITGSLDTTALESALSGLVARHEILRTRFVADDNGQPTQLIDPPAPLPVTVHDLRDIEDAVAREAAARRVVEVEGGRPFDLAAGPLLRADVIRLADQDQHLLITMHHIVSDGWSEGVIARELRDRYAAALGHHEVDLPAPALQYADFSVWQRQWLTGDTLDRQLDYWRGNLTGLEPLELPTDQRRPTERSSGGAAVTFTIPPEVADTLKATAAGNGASLFMTLLATFQLLLSKYSGQEDVAVGTPIAGRNRAEIEDMIGFFVNTLVMRTDLSGDPTFTELLARVRDTALGAYDHQDLPFERLVEEIAPRRDLSRNPLFQTMLVLQNIPDTDTWSLPDLTVEAIPIPVQDAKFDLTLTVFDEVGSGLRASVEYRTDLFAQATVRRLVGHFQTLLAAVATAPDTHLSQLDMLTPAERRQILVEWNDTTTDYPNTKTTHQLIEERAERSPDVVAVRGDDEILTYRQVNERANRLAHHLRTRYGIGPGGLVAVCLDRSPDMICALLGILKAGAAYAPLDPDYPADRLAYMVADTGTPVVVTHTDHIGRLPAGTAQFRVDQDWATLAEEPIGNPEPVASPQDLAYVIYTSGSTGRPKGVQIRHHSLVNLVHWTMTSFAMKPGDRVALLAGVGFDAAAWELWPALTAGTTCCITTDTIRLTPDLLQQWLQDQNIRGTFVPTPMLEALAALPWNNTTSLEYVLTGGDLLHLPTDTTLPFRVINNYGPTESTVLVTSTEITPGDPIPPIGRPIANTNLYIVDKHHHPVPIGIPGELLIAGTGLALGYLNQPEQTREKFIECDVAGTPRRMYRTGDLVKWRPDGQMEFIGRIDNQVKLRGYRIELGEIEATLLTHPTVTATTVVVREDTPGDKRLVAYTVTANGGDPTEPTAGELRAHLQRHLPDYMVPAVFVTLDQLPLTPNGKVDRKALPVPDPQRPDLDATYTAPRSPVERAITAIWSDVLTVDTIGIHDNFFELGGHSLLATQVTSRLRKTLGVDVPVRTLFAAPTPAQLATAMADIMMSAISAQFGGARR
ncbi:amino acid adenylation domain-containing protein [Embleya sp. NBC_00896]|uniref:non-ribosomal peptide synthetase n=1 Tax=Embleya sp. NBC_00896 TaxID=2975961 RepID=UPI0038689884|nr:amino acid adenylation domain-containing protein [Embleya sp. NBC_00896]